MKVVLFVRQNNVNANGIYYFKQVGSLILLSQVMSITEIL